jgi:hypothetical protein
MVGERRFGGTDAIDGALDRLADRGAGELPGLRKARGRPAMPVAASTWSTSASSSACSDAIDARS